MVLDNSDEINALLGKGCEFQGKLTFKGTVRVEGKFKGEIKTKSNLVVGENAQIDGDLNVGSILIFGNVTGNIRANDYIVINPGASVEANIITKSLEIKKGAIFEGNCMMNDIVDFDTQARLDEI